jgi:tRNA nucleotidyltransferase (CCA-adding enzyme)
MSFGWVPIRQEQVFLVGGAVRDALLGLESQDRDWVVVGATPEDLLSRGFTPVGADFPVFLHPETQEEYALARTERKTGAGHRDFFVSFSPEVTLEEDLSRRDLTINAIAQAPDGTFIDPYGGQHDLARHVLRHVGPAFEEDPLRILRVARFAARYPMFSVDPSTLRLMSDMVSRSLLAHLTPERVMVECNKAFNSPEPWRFFQVLHAVKGDGALFGQPLHITDMETALKRPGVSSLPLVWQQALAFATSGLTTYQTLSMSYRYRFSKDLEHASQFLLFHGHEAAQIASSPEAAWKVCRSLDGARRPERVEGFLNALETQHALSFSGARAGMVAVLQLHLGEQLADVPKAEKPLRVETLRYEAFKQGWYMAYPKPSKNASFPR